MKSSKTKKALLSTILIILALSVLLNFYLYKQLKLYITTLYVVELDPLGLSAFQNELPKPSDSKQIVIFFGDSRAEYWPDPTLDRFTFINRGLGNQTSAQVAIRFEAHVKPLHPDIVIIQVCINDLKTIPLFPEREQEIIADCEANLLKIIQDSRSINATVIITTVIPPTGKVPLTRRLAWSDNVYKAVNKVNAFILNMTNEHIIAFDAASLVSDGESKLKLEYSNDFLHLNDTGYQILNTELTNILEEIK